MENMNVMNLKGQNRKILSLKDLESVYGGSAPSRQVMDMYAKSILEGMRRAKARGWTFEQYIANTYIGQTTDPALHPLLRQHWDEI